MTMLRKIDPRHWRLLRRSFDRVRQRYFSVPGSDRQFELDTKVTVDEVRRELGEQSFMPSWDLSYYYEGEDLNMIRVYYDETVDPDRPWRQLHVRGFETKMGIQLAVHDELYAVEHPRGHLHDETFSLDRGTTMVRGVLDEAGIEYDQRHIPIGHHGGADDHAH